MISYFRNYLYNKSKPLLLVKKKKIQKSKQKLNKDTIYIIKRDRWHGMFSNVHYVILHIIFCFKNNYTTLIDMKNFPSIYNEKHKIKKTFNAWEYYFKQPSKVKLDKIYKQKNYFFSDSNNIDTSKIFSKDYKKYKKILKNLIHKDIINESNKFKKKFFKNKKILGIHIRGSYQKKAAAHPFPPTIQQIKSETRKLMDKKKFDFIFLVTEELNYLEKMKKYFPDKIINYDSFKSDEDIFSSYPRKNHRYRIGLETIINMLLLSEVNHLLHSNSNFSAMSVHFSNKRLKQTIIYNGKNSKNIFISNFLWYFKFFLPFQFGGFKNKLITK